MDFSSSPLFISAMNSTKPKRPLPKWPLYPYHFIIGDLV